MPEGDTVHLAARRLSSALSGKLLTTSDFRVPALATTDLRGRRMDEVVARGKHLLMRIDDARTIHSHLGMDGEWHIYRTGERWRAPGFAARLVLAAEGHVAVGFRLHRLELVATSHEPSLVGHLGPDPLGPDWDPDEAVARLAARGERPISEALIDQRVIAGPGNVYKSEICFLRGLHPLIPVQDVADLAALVDLTHRLMAANRTTGRQITTGDPRPGRLHWVYGRAGKPCRRCGTEIRVSGREEPGERVTFWCPSCQPGAP